VKNKVCFNIVKKLNYWNPCTMDFPKVARKWHNKKRDS